MPVQKEWCWLGGGLSILPLSLLFSNLCAGFYVHPWNQLLSDCGRFSDARSSIWMPGTALWTVVLISIAVSKQLEFFYPAWAIFLFGSPWIIWNLCVSIPWGKQDSLQLLLSTCVEGPCSWNIGRIPFCHRVCMCFLQEKHTKIYSHPEAIACLENACWDCEYKTRNFCKDGCKFFKICLVSEIFNYTSRNFLHCVLLNLR